MVANWTKIIMLNKVTTDETLAPIMAYTRGKKNCFSNYAHLALVTPFTKKSDRKCLKYGYEKESNLT